MPDRLSEKSANIVENIACRVAQKKGGIITPNDIAPHLPLSLGLIKSCLDDMVDGAAVIRPPESELARYEFTAFRSSKDSGAPPASNSAKAGECVGCTQPTQRQNEILCRSCERALNEELEPLAQKTAWPAEAVYEHELLHAASKLGAEQLRAEQLAGATRYTLRQVREKLKKMALDHYVQVQVEENSGALLYGFPAVDYSDDNYRRRMGAIRAYPASVMEEVQLRVTRIVLTLASMLVAMFIPVIWGVPLPLMVVAFILIAPIVAFRMWRKGRRQVDVT